MLLGCLKTLPKPYQILDWYWALAFLWQNNNIAKCADGRVGKPHSKGSKFLVSKCLYCFSPDWLEKLPHSSHFPKCYSKRHQKPFVRQMSCRSWEKVAVKWWISKDIVFVTKKIAFLWHFLVTKTICFEIHHLSVSKCFDTLERVKTMSNLPFPIIWWSNFTCNDLLDFIIYDSPFS